MLHCSIRVFAPTLRTGFPPSHSAALGLVLGAPTHTERPFVKQTKKQTNKGTHDLIDLDKSDWSMVHCSGILVRAGRRVASRQGDYGIVKPGSKGEGGAPC